MAKALGKEINKHTMHSSIKFCGNTRCSWGVINQISHIWPKIPIFELCITIDAPHIWIKRRGNGLVYTLSMLEPSALMIHRDSVKLQVRYSSTNPKSQKSGLKCSSLCLILHHDHWQTPPLVTKKPMVYGTWDKFKWQMPYWPMYS